MRLATLLTVAALGCGLGLLPAAAAARPRAAATSGKSAKQPTGPVEDQLGFDTAGIMARQSRVEADIHECMKAQGFDYVPIDPFAQRAAVTGASRLSDEDFLNQFGYGISTLWGRGGAQSDPNQRCARASARRTGAPTTARCGGEPRRDVPGRGRQRRLHKARGLHPQGDRERFGGAQVLTQLQGKLDQLDERILADQRMVRASERWTSCMAEAGYHYEDPDEIDSDLTKRMEKIVGPVARPVRDRPGPGQKPCRTTTRRSPRSSATRSRRPRRLRVRAQGHHARRGRRAPPVRGAVPPEQPDADQPGQAGPLIARQRGRRARTPSRASPAAPAGRPREAARRRRRWSAAPRPARRARDPRGAGRAPRTTT